MKTYCTLEELEEIEHTLSARISDYEHSQIKNAVSLKEFIDRYYPVEILVRLSISNEGIYFDFVLVVLKNTKYKLGIFRDSKHYVIRPENAVEHGIITWDWTAATKPNYIGVPTKKKITDWIDYWTLIMDGTIKTKNEWEKKRVEFIDEMKEHNALINPDGCSGKLVSGPFMLTFSIKDGHINQRFDVNNHGFEATIDNFLKYTKR